MNRIEIRGYKSFRDLCLELKPINLLIGSNGAGKSNFLSFFEFLNRMYEQKLAEYVALNGGTDKFFFQGGKMTESIYANIYFRDNFYLFELKEGDPEEIRARMDLLAARRREKQPLEFPSAGSTFKRPEGYFAGKLIDEAGFRGYRIGDAQVSEKHCGFVINRGNATAAQVMELCRQIRQRVLEKDGVELEMEVRRWGRF